MTNTSSELRRILIVDDTPAIHDSFATILAAESHTALTIEKTRVNADHLSRPQVRSLYELDHAFQGHEALEKTQRAMVRGDAFDLAFVDMRMPPGWDGLQTIEQLWRVDPNLPVVL